MDVIIYLLASLLSFWALRMFWQALVKRSVPFLLNAVLSMILISWGIFTMTLMPLVLSVALSWFLQRFIIPKIQKMNEKPVQAQEEEGR